VLVRQAMNFALPQDAIIKTSIRATASRCELGFPTIYPSADESFWHYGYDPEKAKALLKQAGMPKGFSTTLSYKPAFRNRRRSRRSTRPVFGRSVSRSSSTSCRPAPSYDYVSKRSQPMIFYTDAPWNPDPGYSNYLYFDSKSFVDYSNYKNAKVDSLIENGLNMVDLAKRLPMYKQAQKIYVGEAPWVFIVRPNPALAVRKQRARLDLLHVEQRSLPGLHQVICMSSSVGAPGGAPPESRRSHGQAGRQGRVVTGGASGIAVGSPRHTRRRRDRRRRRQERAGRAGGCRRHLRRAAPRPRGECRCDRRSAGRRDVERCVPIAAARSTSSSTTPLDTVSLLVDMPLSMWQQMIDVNLTSLFLVTKAVLPTMTSSGSGGFINTGSQLALEGTDLMTHYCAAKAGVHGLTRALAHELAPYNITVNAVAPGATETPLLDGIPQTGSRRRERRSPRAVRQGGGDRADLRPARVRRGGYYTGATLNSPAAT